MIEKGHIVVCVCVHLYRIEHTHTRTHRVFVVCDYLFVHWPQSRYKSNNNFDFFRIRHFVLLTIFFVFFCFCFLAQHYLWWTEIAKGKNGRWQSQVHLSLLYILIVWMQYINCVYRGDRGVGERMVDFDFSCNFLNKYFFYQFSIFPQNMLVSYNIF